MAWFNQLAHVRGLQVFKEIHRVLKPGGTAIMSFSNRCNHAPVAYLPRAVWNGLHGQLHAHAACCPLSAIKYAYAWRAASKAVCWGMHQRRCQGEHARLQSPCVWAAVWHRCFPTKAIAIWNMTGDLGG